MKFSIGYQLPDENDSITDIIRDYPESISEVYFALPGASSGRSPLATNDGWSEAEAWEAMSHDLQYLSRAGINLSLLFNASCYGAAAMATETKKKVISSIEKLQKICNVNTVTTTSIFIARIVKTEFTDLEVRASVNMKTRSIQAMEQLDIFFDGFYLKRELNRHPVIISSLHKWCKSNGKSLHLLANSGCLYDCAYQNFHDNLVAHEKDIELKHSIPTRYPAPCWEYLDNPARHHNLLSNTWIRPEDIRHYSTWFDTVKLATRMHSRPRTVIGAYTKGKYRGNLLDLFEPGHSPILRKKIIDNSKFPDNWHTQTTSCNHNCEKCNYCREVFNKVCSTLGNDIDVSISDRIMQPIKSCENGCRTDCRRPCNAQSPAEITV